MNTFIHRGRFAPLLGLVLALVPAARAIPPHGEFELRYRIAVRRTGWTPSELQQLWQDWQQSGTGAIGSREAASTRAK